MLLRFIGSLPHSAEAQAAYAVGYAELFALITWTSVGLMGAAAAVAGQNLGAGHPERAIRGVQIASRIGMGVAAFVGASSSYTSSCWRFGLTTRMSSRSGPSCFAICASRASSSPWRHVYRRTPRHGRHAQSPDHHLVSRRWALWDRGTLQSLGRLDAAGVWSAIVLGHLTGASCRS
jgi:hypothetical protein